MPLRSNQIRSGLDTMWQAKVSFFNGINQPNHSTNQKRPCSTTHRIKKELSICQSLLFLDLVKFPVLSPIRPQAPLLLVPFRHFLLSFSLATTLLQQTQKNFDFSTSAQQVTNLRPPISSRHSFIATLGIARLSLQTQKLGLVGVATHRDAPLACPNVKEP